jgi:hypothetical protein
MRSSPSDHSARNLLDRARSGDLPFTKSTDYDSFLVAYDDEGEIEYRLVVDSHQSKPSSLFISLSLFQQVWARLDMCAIFMDLAISAHFLCVVVR